MELYFHFLQHDQLLYSSRKSVKKKTEKKTKKRKNKEDEHSTRTEGSTSGSVASPMHTRVAHKSPDSPAQNTRSKKRLHMWTFVWLWPYKIVNLDLFILNLMLRIWTFYFKLASGSYSTLMYVCEPETLCVLKIQEMNIMCWMFSTLCTCVMVNLFFREI